MAPRGVLGPARGWRRPRGPGWGCTGAWNLGWHGRGLLLKGTWGLVLVYVTPEPCGDRRLPGRQTAAGAGLWAGAVCHGAEFICTSVLIENKGLWKSCIGACSALCMCFMWRCWCSSFPSRCKVQGSAAEVCGGTGWDQGDTCIHRLSGRAGQEAEDLYVQVHNKKACREVFLLCFKCQSGLVWDSGGAGPSRVRGAQGLGRLKKGLVPCHSQIRGAAQLLGDAVNLILTRGLQHSGYPLIS